MNSKDWSLFTNILSRFVTTCESKSLSESVVLLRDYVNPYVQQNIPNTKIWEAGRCTTAALTFFPAMTIETGAGSKIKFIDSGMMSNNPSEQVEEEATRLWTSENPIQCMLSIGCGHFGANNLDQSTASALDFLEDIIRLSTN